MDSRLFVDELKQLQASHAELIRKSEMAVSRGPVPDLIHEDLAPVYRQKIGKLTDAFESEALKAEAFERIRDLIDAVVLTPVSEAELSIDLRGAFASMLELCACDGIKNASEALALEALQIQMVAGAGFGRSRHSLTATI